MLLRRRRARRPVGTGADADAAELPGTPEPAWSRLLVELAEHNLEQADRTLRAARDAGVPIAAGHDWHPFWNLQIEIRRMIAHGLSAAEALAAATAGSARALGLDAHVGTVAEGMLADLLVVDGDPLSEPELLGAPRARSGSCCSSGRRSPARRSSRPSTGSTGQQIGRGRALRAPHNPQVNRQPDGPAPRGRRLPREGADSDRRWRGKARRPGARPQPGPRGT